MMKYFLPAAIVTVFAVFGSSETPVRAFGPSACARLAAERQRVASDGRNVRINAERVSLIKTNDPAVANRQLARATAYLQDKRFQHRHLTPLEKSLDAPSMQLAEDQVAFWRAKQTEIESAGAIKTGEGNAWIARLNAAIARAENEFKVDAAELDAQIAQCKRTRSSSVPGSRTQPERASSWNGTWYSGPYTIEISGSSGKLDYTFQRHEGEGGCCPTTDTGTGTCTVSGSEADCTEAGDYHDTDKDIHHESQVALTLSGDTISSKSTVKADNYSITLASGQPCSDFAQCTGLHPGAVFNSTWTRRKP